MRSILRRRRPKPRIDRAFTEEVVPSIWGIDPSTCTYSQLRAYLDHYEAASSFMHDNFVILNHAAVIRLVQTVQRSARSNIQDLLGAIENTQPTCLRQDYQPQSVIAALDFACKLWLFLELDFQDEQKFLTELISEKLSVVKTGRKPYGEQLSKDFSQKTLVRRAGIGIVWTSDLSEHLELVGTSTIRVFMHAGALSAYSREAMSLFPHDLLAETERTIDILFPSAALKGQKRIRQISEKNFVDIELAVPGQCFRDLSVYPIWRERLSLIQEAYDDSRPKRLKQWYWDRRRRNDWATFWIAVVVFCLTVVFGIISSVTGIMQVVISYRAFVVER